jgi:hypothetical protein
VHTCTTTNGVSDVVEKESHDGSGYDTE